MSCYWDLKCRTCGEHAGFSVNHGGKKLAELWSARGAYRALRDVDMVDEVRFYGQQPDDFQAFVDKHFDHDVLPRSEYGAYLDGTKDP